MTQEEKIKAILEICHNCIILVSRFNFDKRGNRYHDAFTVIGESYKCLGHSRGIGTRYDYGFMQLDVESNISVIILS